MKKLIIFALFSIVALTPVYSQPVALKADPDSVLIKQLYDLEFTLNNLLSKRDLAAYETYLADDYVRISANGQIKTKEEVLQQFRTTQPEEVVPEILQIRLYGNTAIMLIHLTIIHEESGKKVIRESLLTKVFVMKNERWYMVSNQGTPIK